MFKAKFIISVLMLFVLTVSTPAFAQTDDLGFYFSPEVAYVLPTDSDVDDAVFVGARLGYDLHANWALELESGWTELGVDSDFASDNLDIEMIPVMANLRYNFDRCDWGNVYLFGGVGASFNHLEDGSGRDLEIDDSVAWQAGVGTAIPLSDSIDGFIDVRYFYNEPDIEFRGESISDDARFPSDANLQSVWFNLGLQF